MLYGMSSCIDNSKILKLVLDKTPGRQVEECEILIASFKRESRYQPPPVPQMPMKTLEVISTHPAEQTPHPRPQVSKLTEKISDRDINSTEVTAQETHDTSLEQELDSAVSLLQEKNSDYFHTDQKPEVTKEDESEESDADDDVKSKNEAAACCSTDNTSQSCTTEMCNPKTEEEITVEDFSSLPWPIFINKQAADFLKGKKTTKRVINNIKTKLHALGEGHRGKALCHKCIQPKDNLYETYLYKESRIIWQETIQYSEKLSTPQTGRIYTDVIKVLWIATRHTTNQLNDVLQKTKTALKKSRNSNPLKLHQCELVGKSTNSFKVPRQFTEQSTCQLPTQSEFQPEYRPLPNLFEGEYSLMQFHPFHEFLNAFLNNDLSNYDTAICMSPQEYDIVHLPYRTEPIVLCGRSGTGKTTTCIYRMWNEYKASWEVFSYDEAEVTDYLHQIFVTKNPVLCSQVKKHFEKLVNGHPKLKKIRTQSSGRKHKSLMNICHESFPLFLTSRQFLLLLDCSLPGKPFFDRDEKGDLTMHLCNSDYNQDMNPDLLFTDNVDNDHNEDESQCKKQWIEITADYFCRDVWPRLKTRRPIKDPLLVWMEIQSFIKGSRNALMSENGHLSKEEYTNGIGKKMAPSFTLNERQDVYACFLEYENVLRNRASDFDCDRLFDECDVVFSIFNRFPKQPDSWHVDHFYIDEIQDFTQAELSLLLKCSNHPSGTFCTGDTAQSIMKGVFFRFEDLRSQFWELATNQPASKVVVPKLLQLTDNFRAHSGILNLAQGIIKLMKKFFKISFQDALLPIEVAMFEGPEPILLDAESTEELTSVLLGNVNDSTATHLELGAHQAILVRSEEAKTKLPESLKSGIVLTVLEAKGLEFNDVLLYDFFKDSPVCTFVIIIKCSFF